MGIINRELDQSEQKLLFQETYSGAQQLATGLTNILCQAPWPCQFQGAQIMAHGLSGSPTYEIALNRFIAGTGFTTWLLAKGTSNIPANYGTSGSGAFGSSLFGASGMVTVLTGATNGSTLANIQANDVITVTTGGANASANAVVIGVVLKPIQDMVQYLGLGI